jgi:hypothetical protein
MCACELDGCQDELGGCQDLCVQVNMVDVKMTQFVPIHKLMVRDISFCQGANDTLLLSAAMDKTVKVTNLLSKNIVQR